MDKTLPKLVCMKTIGGVTALRVLTTVGGAQGSYIKLLAGVGNPYWIWNSLPVADNKVIAADFTNAPIASSDISVNNANAAPLLADPPSVAPESVLTFDT